MLVERGLDREIVVLRETVVLGGERSRQRGNGEGRDIDSRSEIVVLGKIDRGIEKM